MFVGQDLRPSMQCLTSCGCVSKVIYVLDQGPMYDHYFGVNLALKFDLFLLVPGICPTNFLKKE